MAKEYNIKQLMIISTPLSWSEPKPTQRICLGFSRKNPGLRHRNDIKYMIYDNCKTTLNETVSVQDADIYKKTHENLERKLNDVQVNEDKAY